MQRLETNRLDLGTKESTLQISAGR